MNSSPSRDVFDGLREELEEQIDRRGLRPYAPERGYDWIGTIRRAVRVTGYDGYNADSVLVDIYETLVVEPPGELWGFDPSRGTRLDQRFRTVVASRLANHVRNDARRRRRTRTVTFSDLMASPADDPDTIFDAADPSQPDPEWLHVFCRFLERQRRGDDLLLWFLAHAHGRGDADLDTLGWDENRKVQRKNDIRWMLGVFTQTYPDFYNDLEQVLRRPLPPRARPTRTLMVREGTLIPVHPLFTSTLHPHTKIRLPGGRMEWVDTVELITEEANAAGLFHPIQARSAIFEG